ncbi:MAG: FAD-dependent oxidoreductase [Dehalococcoidia bacterium]|nr:Rhodocoxin reductase [Chloroflexota bacterium]
MRYVIIGNSAAGISCAENLRKLHPSSRITIVSDENERAYSRCLISRFVDGRLKKEGLYFKPKSFYRDYGIEILLGHKIIEIEREKSRLLYENSQEISYDKLLIATGSRAFRPDIEGLDLEGVHEFHSMNDAENIVSRLKEVSQLQTVASYKESLL